MLTTYYNLTGLIYNAFSRFKTFALNNSYAFNVTYIADSFTKFPYINHSNLHLFKKFCEKYTRSLNSTVYNCSINSFVSNDDPSLNNTDINECTYIYGYYLLKFSNSYDVLATIDWY